MTNELFILILAVHLYTTIFMTGVIWIIQLVHYPMFTDLDARFFEKSMKDHQKGMSQVVLITMLIEIFTGASLIIFSQGVSFLIILNFIALLVIWFVTFMISVPCHNRLLISKNNDVIKKLVQSNWIRTVLWSIRSIGLLYFILGKIMVTL